MFLIPPTGVGGYFKPFLQPHSKEFQSRPRLVGGSFKSALFINNQEFCGPRVKINSWDLNNPPTAVGGIEASTWKRFIERT